MNEAAEKQHAETRRIIRFVFLYLSVGLVIAAYSMTIYSYVSMQVSDNARINAAGRLRMLTQKITKEILMYQDGVLPKSNVLNSTLVFNATVYGISRGGSVPLDMNPTMSSRLPAIDDPESRARLEEVIREWAPFKLHVAQFLKDGNLVSLRYIQEHNEDLINTIDRTVMTIQKHSDSDLRDLWLIIISAIILVAGGVLAAMVRQVKRYRSAETRLAEIEQLLPICSSCKKIRTDNDHPENPRSWTSIDEYLRDKKDMVFTHSICPDCMMKLYPGMLKGGTKK
jgi:nitrate/nitrite-specific signal transduction histidine kinase